MEQERQGLLHREQHALRVAAEGVVERGFSDGADGLELATPGGGHQCVDAACFGLDPVVQAIEVREPRGIGLNGGGAWTDLGGG